MLQNNQSPLISLSDTETTQRYEPCKNVPHKSGEENNFEDFWQKAQIKSLWRTRTVSENLGTCNICRLLVPLFFLLFCASSIDLLLRRNKLLNHIQANPWHYRKTKHLLMSEVFLMFKVCAFFFLRDYQYNPRLIACITVQLENRSVLFQCGTYSETVLHCVHNLKANLMLLSSLLQKDWSVIWIQYDFISALLQRTNFYLN